MLNCLDGIGLAALEDHQILETNSGQGDYVSLSKFSNGTETVCDYQQSTLQIDGRPYPLPNDFVKRPALTRG